MVWPWLFPAKQESSWEDASELVGEAVPEDPVLESRGERVCSDKNRTYIFAAYFKYSILLILVFSTVCMTGNFCAC